MEQYTNKQQEENAFELAYDVIKGFTEAGHRHVCRKCWNNFTEIFDLHLLYCSTHVEIYGCPQCDNVIHFTK